MPQPRYDLTFPLAAVAARKILAAERYERRAAALRAEAAAMTAEHERRLAKVKR